MVFQKSIPKKITTSLTSRPSTAQIVIENPLDEDIFINGIEIIPDAEFSKKGILIILINEVPVFDKNDSEALFGYAKFPVPLGKTLRRSNDIQIFAWNGEDSNEINVRFNLSLSKVLQPFNSQAETLGKDVFNQLVSQTTVLFEEKVRLVSTETVLINLKGYLKLIVFISAGNATLPTSITPSGWIANNNVDDAIDGDIVTDGVNSLSKTTAGSPTLKIDHGSIATRHLFGKFDKDPNVGTKTLTVDVSDDDISYANLLPTQDWNSTGVDPEIIDAGTTSFRYSRWTWEVEGGEAMVISIYEIYDALTMGGTGSLTFEVRDPETDTWSEFIASSEFGTITQGASAIIEQIGDVTTKSVSGKTYALPSTQTDFRAKYSITVNALKNAVSIQKVA